MAIEPSSRATLKRIGDELGVSVTTVSRALSGQARQYRISKKTEAAVRKLAKELNFAPNQLARGLRLNKTMTIGLVIPDIANPFFASIANQVAVEVHKRGYVVILCDSQESEEMEIMSLEVLRSRNVEGMIICPVGLSVEHLREFEKGSLPVVLADRYFPGLAVPYVASDNFNGAKEAAKHLIDNGHRRIACVQGLRESSPNEDRVRGFKAALAAAHIPFDKSLVVGDSFGEQNGYIQTKLLLKAKRDFTAILAFSNLIGLGALRAITEEGLKVPDDLSIINFDDQPYQAYMSPPMTAVAQENAEIGQIAVKLLFDRILSPEQPVKGGVLVPTRLMVRGSVKKIAAV